MMPRLKVLLSLTLATLSATAWNATSVAQAANPAGPGTSDNNTTQSQPAPIERAPAATNAFNSVLAPGQTLATTSNFAGAQPSPGVYLRIGQNSSVSAVAVGAERTELSVQRGIANVDVHHSASGEQILVDLPGGQTALLKDGLYTFNASSNTVRVLHGEADAYPAGQTDAKPIKVKEDHAVTFDSEAKVKAAEFQPFQARTDLIPYANTYAGNRGSGSHYGYGPYGDGFAYGYPYYAYGDPYFGPYWGYPYWGYGYPFGFGLGFGYYGGFGGFHGGGFHGGGVRGR